jgi:hypothetical protein
MVPERPGLLDRCVPVETDLMPKHSPFYLSGRVRPWAPILHKEAVQILLLVSMTWHDDDPSARGTCPDIPADARLLL